MPSRSLGFDCLDLEYCATPPVGLALAELVGSVGDLMASGEAGARVLFGATTAEQVEQNARAVPVLSALVPAELAVLRGL